MYSSTVSYLECYGNVCTVSETRGTVYCSTSCEQLMYWEDKPLIGEENVYLSASFSLTPHPA